MKKKSFSFSNDLFFFCRTLTQQPMRVVMPTGAVQTTGTAQIIQTHLMPQAMLKQGKQIKSKMFNHLN